MLSPSFFDELDRICGAMAELLRPEAEFRADFALNLARQMKTEPSTALDNYRSWWGSMGSMADFIPEAPGANRRYMQLQIDLVQLFEAEGHHSERAARMAKIFENWLASRQP